MGSYTIVPENSCGIWKGFMTHHASRSTLSLVGLVSILCFWLPGASALAQGYVVYQNTDSSGGKKSIYLPDPHTMFIRYTANTSADYAGSPKVEGAAYYAELWWGPGTGRSEDSLLPVPGSRVIFRTGSSAGLIVGNSRLVIPAQFGGDEVTFQLRVWENHQQKIGTWAEALESTPVHGTSNLFDWQLTGMNRLGESIVGSGSIAKGIQTFQWFVPEPSSWMILGLGLVSLGAGRALTRTRK